MSIASEVADVLRKDPSGRIHFKVDNILVNKKQMESVALAIEAGDIAIETEGTGGALGAAYSSYVSRRWTAGERKLIGKISLAGPNTVKNNVGRAAIFHESVHALMDVAAIKITMHNDEVVAYLADALYMKATKVNAGTNSAEDKKILQAARAVVDQHTMLERPGVTLTWQQCDALRDAIKANSKYGG